MYNLKADSNTVKIGVRAILYNHIQVLSDSNIYKYSDCSSYRHNCVCLKIGEYYTINALPNNETPEVFRRLYELMKAWNGHSLKEAASLEVDGVSGATYSSNAVIGNVRAGSDYALGLKDVKTEHSAGFVSSISTTVRDGR